MKKILSIIVLAVLVSSCATKREDQTPPPRKSPILNRSVPYELNIPVHYEDIDLSVICTGNGFIHDPEIDRENEYRDFLIQSKSEHAHVRCFTRGAKTRGPVNSFNMNGTTYILKLRHNIYDRPFNRTFFEIMKEEAYCIGKPLLTTIELSEWPNNPWALAYSNSPSFKADFENLEITITE